ncbi:MAG: HAD family hydrolase [Halanaerobiaceae bacterium]
MSELKAVIFDMDGVIIDSEPIHYEVNKKLYDELEIEIKDEEYRKFIGVSNSDHWGYLKEKHKLVESIEELVARQNSRNIGHLNNSTEEPILGVVQLIEELERQNIKIGLASSSDMRYIKAVIEKFGIDDYFQTMTSGEDMERGKPHPDIFQETASKLDEDSENCVVIEDSENGVKAALNANMKCIGYINPNSHNQDLSLAHITVDSIEKITIQMLRDLFV